MNRVKVIRRVRFRVCRAPEPDSRLRGQGRADVGDKIVKRWVFAQAACYISRSCPGHGPTLESHTNALSSVKRRFRILLLDEEHVLRDVWVKRDVSFNFALRMDHTALSSRLLAPRLFEFDIYIPSQVLLLSHYVQTSLLQPLTKIRSPRFYNRCDCCKVNIPYSNCSTL